MKELPKLTNILLNYKQINIHIDLIKKYCLLPMYKNISLKPSLEMDQLTDKFNVPKPSIKIINITSTGLSFDITSTLNSILSKYNLASSQGEDLQPKLDQIIDHWESLKRANQLKMAFPKLYQYYLKKESKFRQVHNIPLNKKAPRTIFKKFKQEQINNIQYLKNHLSQITDCSYFLSVIDLEKLNLIVATQIMNLRKKGKYLDSSYLYLTEYLHINDQLVRKNYQIKRYTINALGIEEVEIIAIKDIHQYLYPRPSKETKVSSKAKLQEKQYSYTFLESTPKQTYEILGKYYKLGSTADNEEQRKQLLQRKINYYQALPIKSLKVGLNSFEGYLGFCLEDGTIILDKFFENLTTGRIAENQAIYITSEEEFDRITKLTKIECMNAIRAGKIKSRRKTHAGEWEKRLDKMEHK